MKILGKLKHDFLATFETIGTLISETAHWVRRDTRNPSLVPHRMASCDFHCCYTLILKVTLTPDLIVV